MKLAFYKGRAGGSLFAKLIKLWTRGPYSHVELVLGDNGVSFICASSSIMDGGVRIKEMRALSADNWDLVDIGFMPDVHVDDPVIENELGCPYDWKGILLSQVLPIARQHKHAWFCSEFCAHVIGLSQPHRYSPNSLYQVVKDINRITA